MAHDSIIVAHPGAQYSRETALAVQDAGLLKAYVTGVYYKPYTALSRVLRLSSRVERQMKRRYKGELCPEFVRQHPWEELLHLTVARTKPFSAYAGPVLRWRNRRFDRFVARLVADERPSAVICYDTCAVETFKAAKSVGTLRILDQSVGHWCTLSKLLREEAELNPEFADSMPIDLPEDFLDRCAEEGQLADHVLAGSEYVKDTMMRHGVGLSSVTVMPYGADIEQFTPKPEVHDGVFRILFVGQLSQRKGIKYLLEAMRQLHMPQVTLTLVGGVVGSGRGLLRYRDHFRHVDAVPHSEIHRYFQRADLFVYPSLHEGSAIAIYEALATGLPVITTPNSGSVVRDGVEGFIVPIRDVDSLRERIVTLWQDRDMRTEMGRNARKRSERFTWEAYRRRLGTLLHRLLSFSTGDIRPETCDHETASAAPESCRD